MFASSAKSSVQALLSEQTDVPTQLPAPSQESLVVQFSESLQALPAGVGGKTQRPVAGSHEFVVQSSKSSHWPPIGP